MKDLKTRPNTGMSNGSVTAEGARELGIAAEENKAYDEDRRGCAHEEENRVAIGGLNSGRCGARGVKTLRTALGVGLHGEEREENRCEQKQPSVWMARGHGR